MLRFQDEHVVFNIFEVMKHMNENQQCYWVDIVDETMEDTTSETPVQPLERVIMNTIDCCDKYKDDKIDECVQQFEASEVELLPENLNH